MVARNASCRECRRRDLDLRRPEERLAQLENDNVRLERRCARLKKDNRLLREQLERERRDGHRQASPFRRRKLKKRKKKPGRPKGHQADLRPTPDQHRGVVVVIEACVLTGWIHDLCASVGVRCLVANTSSESWKFKHAKRKTDRDDALRMAQLAAMGQLPMASKATREWRSLIATRRFHLAAKSGCAYDSRNPQPEHRNVPTGIQFLVGTFVPRVNASNPSQNDIHMSNWEKDGVF